MTFTILAADPTQHVLAVGTASKSLAVGAMVPAVDPELGAVASQAYTNPRLRKQMLQALRAGRSTQAAVAAIPELDPDWDYRQVAVIDTAGRAAVHTGARTTGWAGHRLGTGWVVAGNCLTGEEVLSAMRDDFTASAASALEPADSGSPLHALARRVLRALQAGERAGGDRRGKQSAALLVTGAQNLAGRTEQPRLDLRIDHDADPLSQLHILLDLAESEARWPHPDQPHPG